MPTSSMKIGTITFIKPETREFVALGHSTIKNQSKKSKIIGSCYDIELEGIEKGTKEAIGSIVATSDKNNQIGYIYYDSNYGIFGKVEQIEKNYPIVETACWYKVKKGNATILMDLEGKGLESYEVEIVEVNYLHKNKNIKLKVTDKKLIEKTGGIIQGMSGTPLLQNGKLIGAINYVSAQDPSIAYAIFIDKLI